jgi:simple sugar transport system ATP-binding protein
MTPVELVTKMIGKELAALDELEVSERSRPGPDRPVLVAADGLARGGAIEPFTLTIRRGEVVGLAGLLGSGRTELARLLFGADHADAGTVDVDGQRVHLRSPRAAMKHRIAFCSENRKTEGLIAELTIRENIALAVQAGRGWLRPIPRRRQLELAARYIEALDIRPADPDAVVGTLSGGNQQKVLLARWLATEPRLLILDEPTRGIDIGAKAEIQRLVASLSEDGMAVLFVSAELEEVLRLSHHVAVLRDRRVVAQLANDGLTPEEIMSTIADGTGS